MKQIKNKKLYPYINKKVGNIIHIFDPVFMTNFYAVVGKSHNIFRNIMKKEINIDIKKSNSDGKFYVIEQNEQEVGLIWSKDRTIHLIHECFHATSWALRIKGIELSNESDEIFSYYQQFLIKAIRSSK